MPRPTGPTNPVLRRLIRKLRAAGKRNQAGIWTDAAERLEVPRRRRTEVTLGQINRYTNGDETVLVPGKVLAAGNIDHPVTIAAFKFSRPAVKKIVAAGGKAITISRLMEENPHGKNVRLMG
jgi:large subunit ribosomal protein L18e